MLFKDKKHQWKQQSKYIKYVYHFSFPVCFRIMSESEKLDDQMRHGTDYINLPAQLYPTNQAPTWIRK